MTRIRVGVIGCGLISQAIHLPSLFGLREQFTTVGLAEPSEHVRVELGRRYGIEDLFGDHRQLLELDGLDAVLVCSPHGTHAEIIAGALDAGVHVFVEKPLCITPADADRIIALRDSAGCVVQVGYTKRYDVAYEEMCGSLPQSISDLRYINVFTYEPELSQYFRPASFVVATDRGPSPQATGNLEELDQVAAAVGTRDPHEAFVFSEIYLGSLVHDVNLVHGLLEAMGEPTPCSIAASAWWAGPSAAASFTLSNGARWDLAWVESTQLHDFHERITLVFGDSVHTISYPAPYQAHSPAVYESNTGAPRARSVRQVASYHERFTNQLLHFHDCIVNGVACRTPPEQARVDIAVLAELFKAATPVTAGRAQPSPRRGT